MPFILCIIVFAHLAYFLSSWCHCCSTSLHFVFFLNFTHRPKIYFELGLKVKCQLNFKRPPVLLFYLHTQTNVANKQEMKLWNQYALRMGSFVSEIVQAGIGKSQFNFTSKTKASSYFKETNRMLWNISDTCHLCQVWWGTWHGRRRLRAQMQAHGDEGGW